MLNKILGTTSLHALPRSSRTAYVVFFVTIVFIIVAGFLRTTFTSGIVLADLYQNFVSLTISVIVESAPFVVLGVVLSGFLQKFVSYDFVARKLPGNVFARRAVLSLVGVVVPVCECGNVPLGRGLILKGFTPSEAITFLMAAPILNPLTIITTYQAFGWDGGILVGRIVGGFVIANLLGWFFSHTRDENSLLSSSFQQVCAHNHSGGGGGSFFVTFLGELKTIVPVLVAGSAVAGAVRAFVPQETLLVLGSNPFLAVGVMIVLGFVVAVCSNVDAFFALSFVNVFPSYAILVFLLVGPLVDIKMLALLKTTFTVHTIAVLTILVVMVSVTVVCVVGVLGA